MGRVIGPGSHADLQVAPDPGEGLLDSLGRERDLRARRAMCHTAMSHTAMSRTELTGVTLIWGHTL